MAKNKSIDTKVLQNSINDFIKLYNLELSNKEAVEGKQAIEKSLKEKIIGELNKYEH